MLSLNERKALGNMILSDCLQVYLDCADIEMPYKSGHVDLTEIAEEYGTSVSQLNRIYEMGKTEFYSLLGVSRKTMGDDRLRTKVQRMRKKLKKLLDEQKPIH